MLRTPGTCSLIAMSFVLGATQAQAQDQAAGAPGSGLPPAAGSGNPSAASSRLPATVPAQAVPAPTAVAQAKDDAGQQGAADIVVTGTSIRGIAPVGTQPTILNRDDIVASGATTTTEVLRSIPQINNIGADEGNTSPNATQGAGQNNLKGSAVNLRGLGPEATLLLFNGRRLAPNGTITSFGDPSQIPSVALERVEVVVDGASAIYGSDAVGGVVNLITRKRFDGAETSFRYAFGDDIDQKIFSQTLGKTWDSGSISFAYEYNERSRLRGSDRDFITADFRSNGGPDMRQTLASPGTVVVGTTRYAIPLGQNGRGLTAAAFRAGTSNLDDPYALADFLPHQKRHSVTGRLEQDVTDRLHIYVDGFYTHRDFNLRASGSTGGGPVTSTVTVPNTNAFFVSPIAGATSTRVEYSFRNDIGIPLTKGSEENFDGAFGLSYDVGVRDWKLDAFSSYGKSHGVTGFSGLINPTQLALALADGNPATALNVFCDGNQFTCNNPATLAKIFGRRDTNASSSIYQSVAKLDGTLFSLPGGDVHAAVGVEYTYSKYGYLNFATNTSPDNSVRQIKDIHSHRDVLAFFAEAVVPFVTHDPDRLGLNSLDLSLAGRYERYSDFGSTTNPRFGVTWVPVHGLSLRGSYGKSFRAPALADTSDSGTNYFIQNFTDPSSPTGLTRGLVRYGGNAALKPEKATTWSLGADIRPDFAPDFRISAGYYHVNYTDRIASLQGLENVVLGNPTLYGNYFVRNPSAAFLAPFLTSPFLQTPAEPASTLLVFVDAAKNNLGSLKQDGIDFSAFYDHSFDWGKVAATLNVTKTLNLDVSAIAGGAFQDRLSTIQFPVDLRYRASLGYEKGGFSANVFLNHVGNYRNTQVTPAENIKSYTTFDLTLAYRVPESVTGAFGGLRFALSMLNVADRDPPYVRNGLLAFDSANASAIGRFTSFQITKAF